MPELGTRYRKQAAGTRGGAPGLKGGQSQIGGAPRVTVLHPRLPFRSEGFIPLVLGGLPTQPQLSASSGHHFG